MIEAEGFVVGVLAHFYGHRNIAATDDIVGFTEAVQFGVLDIQVVDALGDIGNTKGQ